MNNSGNSTHKPRASDPVHFRNLATGVGSSQALSAASGALRNAEVTATIPAECKPMVPVAEGFSK